MARFWLFIANTIGILIVALLLLWMAGGIPSGLFDSFYVPGSGRIITQK